MGKCPVCNKDINALYLERRVSAVFDMSYNVHLSEGTDSLELTHMSERYEVPDIRDTLGETYYCPECDSEVTDSRTGALNILKGE